MLDYLKLLVVFFEFLVGFFLLLLWVLAAISILYLIFSILGALIANPMAILYLFSLIFVTVTGKRWINAADNSDQCLMPDVTSLNPYEIAALRNGRKGVIQTALFELWNRKLITSRGREEEAEVKSVANQQPQDKIEQAIYDFAHTTRKPADFFSDSGLHSRLDKHLKPINWRLEQWHLKPTDARLKQAILKQAIMKRRIIWFIIFWMGVFFFLLLFEVFAKFEFVFIALFITFLFLVFIDLILAPNERQTQLGRRYYDKLLEHFEWMKSAEKGEIDPAFLISIFGISALTNFGVFASFEQAFAKTASSGTASGGCGGGCGGGGCGGCGGCGG